MKKLQIIIGFYKQKIAKTCKSKRLQDALSNCIFSLQVFVDFSVESWFRHHFNLVARPSAGHYYRASQARQYIVVLRTTNVTYLKFFFVSA